MTPMFLLCFSPISYVCTPDTKEWNTYTNYPDPANSTRRHSPIMRCYFLILISGSTLLVYHCVFNQTFKVFFLSKAGQNMCSNFPRTDTCRHHRCILLDCCCFRFWHTNFRCSNCCFWINGSLYNSCLW